MTEKNEMVNVNTGEIVDNHVGLKVVRETDDFVVVINEEGKYVRKAKYTDYSSFKAESREDKIWLLSIIDADEETGNPMRENVGKEIEVEDIITRQYDKINEDTGDTEYGVLTYLITPDREAYVTSSKSVYFSIRHIMEMIGAPHEEDWENIIVKVGSEKGANGTIIKIRLVG